MVCIETEMEDTIIIPTDKSGHTKWEIILKENSED